MATSPSRSAAALIFLLAALQVAALISGQIPSAIKQCDFHHGKFTNESWIPLSEGCQLQDLVQELSARQPASPKTAVLLLGDSGDRFLVHLLCGQPETPKANNHQARRGSVLLDRYVLRITLQFAATAGSGLD